MISPPGGEKCCSSGQPITEGQWVAMAGSVHTQRPQKNNDMVLHLAVTVETQLN